MFSVEARLMNNFLIYRYYTNNVIEFPVGRYYKPFDVINGLMFEQICIIVKGVYMSFWIVDQNENLSLKYKNNLR